MDIAHERPFPPTKAEFEMLQREIKHLHADVDKVCNLNLSLKSQNARLREALQSLVNNNRGLGPFEHEIKMIIGNTNWAVNQNWIENGEQALNESGDV